MFDHYAKAVVGALLAGLGALLPSLSTGHVTATQWVLIAIASLSTLAGVWATPNSPAPGTTQITAGGGGVMVTTGQMDLAEPAPSSSVVTTTVTADKTLAR